jgi:hypothetical protein
MAVDLTGYRLRRWLRSASAAPPTPGLRKPAPLHAAVVLTWRKVSPSAHFMVDPRNGARAVLRDTGSPAGRFLWSVLVAGELDPMTEGRTDDLAQAKSIAEATLYAFSKSYFCGVWAAGRREDPIGRLITVATRSPDPRHPTGHARCLG